MCVVVGVLALLAPALVRAEEPALKEPVKAPAFRESVKVSLVQVEITVWPKHGEPDACLGLGKDDFELTVGGTSRPIYSVDAVGEETHTEPDAPAPGGMSVVLLFDMYHLDYFYKWAPACPRGLDLAFREARRYVEEEFRDGDRLLLVTFAAWPVLHEGWIHTREEGLRALERLEKNHRVVSDVGRGHVHHEGWIAGLKSLFLAMGRYPGRKDVIWLVEDFAHDDVTAKVYEIAGRAHTNDVVMSAVDLLDSCRSIPSPSGVGGTDWRFPVALSLAADTGGSVFRRDSIASAVAALRAVRKCRYLVSFAEPPTEGRRPRGIHIGLNGKRHDLSLSAPSALESTTSAASVADQEEALFLLPRFRRGLAADAAIWPFRVAATSKKKTRKPRWDVFAVARLEHTEEEDWPDELTELTVHVVLYGDHKLHGSYKKMIVGKELAALRAPGASRLLLFPFHDVPAGDTKLDVTVASNVEEIAANRRKDQTIPRPPHPGQAGPWFLSDHLVRLGDRALMAPSFDDYLTPGQPAWMVGCACRRAGEPDSYQGTLVSSSGGTTVPITLSWLSELDGNAPACGWLFGSIAADLAADVWSFGPPAALQPSVNAPTVEFMVGAPGERSAP